MVKKVCGTQQDLLQQHFFYFSKVDYSEKRNGLKYSRAANSQTLLIEFKLTRNLQNEFKFEFSNFFLVHAMLKYSFH